MSVTRDAFVVEFGEDAARAIEAAAECHREWLDEADGADPFADAISITISFECFSRPEFAQDHGMNIDVDALRTWIRNNIDFTDDILIDPLALFAGAYDEYSLVPLDTDPTPAQALTVQLDTIAKIADYLDR